MGPAEFVIVAPGTDRKGAETLVNRLLESAGQDQLPLRAGVFSARRGKQEPVAPLDLLNRATEALRKAQTQEDGPFVFVQDPQLN